MLSWGPEVRVLVNGQPQPSVEIVDGCAVLRRIWQDGDQVQLALAMPIQRIMAHPFVNHLHGRVAL